jgi:hypothetical protein
MPMGELEVMQDASAGAWIALRLTDDVATITLEVPSGFERYARICHPPTDEDGERVTWAQVAERMGHVAHPQMQWHALVDASDYTSFRDASWQGDHPRRGNLAPDLLEALVGVLAAHTARAAECFFGLWAGWGWMDEGSSGVDGSWRGERRETTTGFVSRPPAFTEQELRRPRLELPGREYILLRGPLRAAGQIGEPAWKGLPFDPQSPNLMWPGDRAWFVASEIDFDSTLVGGSASLVQAILDTPELDAWPLGPDDSLTYDADRINPTS